MLDISIKAAAKVLTNDKAIKEFLTSPVEVEAKLDGLKITVVKMANNGTIDDWVIAYKNAIIYSGEFDYASDETIKKTSIGSSQFKVVLDHFAKIGKNSVPVGTELFVEFLMRKPTVSSNYKKPHGMVLIAHSPTKYTIKNAMLKTKPKGFFIDKRDQYAKSLSLNTPLLMFKGVLGTEATFNKGILHKELQSEFNAYKDSIEWEDNASIVSGVSKIFLAVESVFGGKEEGVVIKYNGKIIKFQQEYQLDNVARAKIKMRFKEDDVEAETSYWASVRGAAEEYLMSNPVGVDLGSYMREAAKHFKKYSPSFSHSKKDTSIIIDDLVLSVKMIATRRLDGNNGALMLGKYRVMTTAHYDIIAEGIRKYDSMTVALITSKDTKDSKALRRKMLETAFGNKIEIVESTSGNLITLMNKSDNNINVIMAGSDRVDSYNTQLARMPDVSVDETPRTDDDISASKVIEKIDDDKYFKANTPKEIHSMYVEIREFYTAV